MNQHPPLNLRFVGVVCIAAFFAAESSRWASAQVVQLPTWRVFAVDTSVLVPDQGTVVLGGTNFARDAVVSRSPPLFPLRSSARQHSAGLGMATVSATIIDHREWDEALLAEARAARPTPPSLDPVALEAVWMSRHITAMRPDAAGRSSIEQVARQAERAAAADQDARRIEVESLLRHGDACLDRGEYATARVFYRTAWRQSPAMMRAQIDAKLSCLRQAQDSAEGRRRPPPRDVDDERGRSRGDPGGA